jgi:hypothetical protein
LNKALTCDINRQSKDRLGLIPVDLKSCYDRMVHSATGMSMKSRGCLEEIIESSFSTIQELKHYLRSRYGDSTKFFSATKGGKPIQGCGQGNGAGPGEWAVVSTPIFNSMRKRGFGIYLRTPLSNNEYHFVGYAFVDDTDLVVGDIPGKAKPISLIPLIQEAMIWWEGTVRATGGATEPEKSFWYLIDHEWKNGKWHYVQPQETDAPILMRNLYGKLVRLKRKGPDDTEKTLGVRQAPTGSRECELEYLCSKSEAWAEKVRTKHIPADLVWESLNTGIMRTLLWPIICMCFTEAECNQIMKPIYDAGLSRSNIVRSLSRSIVHGPRGLCGLALPKLFIESGIYKIDRLCRFGSSEKFITGFLMRETVEYLTLELGLGGNVFDHDYATWSNLATECWVKYVWMFLDKYNIKVEAKTPGLKVIRNADVLLMERFYKFGYRDKEDRRQLNECRKYLQAVSLADISNVQGTHILQDAWEGKNPTGRRKITWPKHPPVKSLNWPLWQEALKVCYGVDRYRRLAVPLGQWIDIKRLSLWYFSPTCDRIIKQNDDLSWSSFACEPTRRGRKNFHTDPVETAFSSLLLQHGNLYPADVSRVNNFLLLHGHDARHPSSLQISFPLTPREKHMDKLGWIADVWFSEHGEGEQFQAAQAIIAGTCEAVSDGSAFEGNEGTAAWCIGEKNIFEIMSAGLRVHGPDVSHCSYRSELAGVYAILLVIWSICQDYGIEDGALEIGTDSESVLERLLWSPSPAHLGDHSWDLLSACKKLLHQLHFIRFTTRHIPGHQDDKPLPTKGLDMWADRNIEMDLWAAQVYPIIPKGSDSGFDSSNIWNISINNQPIVCNFRNSVRKATVGAELLQHWKKDNKVGTDNTEIAWDSFGMAMDEISNKKRNRPRVDAQLEWK